MDINTKRFEIKIVETNDRTKILVDNTFDIQKTDGRNELTIWITNPKPGHGGQWFSKKELAEKMFGDSK